MKRMLIVCMLLCGGCINPDGDPDIRPPLMNTNDFANFDAPTVGTNQIDSTEINVIVAP